MEIFYCLKRIYIRVTLVFVLLNLLNSDVLSQSYGNIIINPKKGYMNVGAEGEYVTRDEGSYDYYSIRYIGKIEMGVRNDLSLMLYAGAGNLNFIYPQSSSSEDFKGSTEFCFGGGVKKNLWTIKPAGLKFFGSVGFLRLWSFDKIESYLGDEYTIIDAKFDWLEYWGGLGASVKFSDFNFYLGIEGKAYERKEVYTKSSYKSGIRSQMFFGVDFNIPYDVTLNLQGKLFEEKAIILGISQTGNFK